MMKAIIIEEDRFAEISEAMKNTQYHLRENSYLCKQTNLTPEQIQFASDEIHRAIHMTFVRWAQSHGASCIKS